MRNLLRVKLAPTAPVCSPTGFLIVLTAALNRSALTKSDIKSDLLHTGRANSEVYVRPKRESDDKRHYWLLVSAAYVLMNA